MRARLRDAGLPTPDVHVLEAGDDPARMGAGTRYPVVVKPTTLSGSRGVIRADDPSSFIAAVDRIRQLLASPDVRTSAGHDLGVVQVERYIDGVEYALEGLLEHGVLGVLAVFDKPDPLEGPYLEEFLYVTPPRAAQATEQAIVAAVAAAARAMGLMAPSMRNAGWRPTGSTSSRWLPVQLAGCARARYGSCAWVANRRASAWVSRRC